MSVVASATDVVTPSVVKEGLGDPVPLGLSLSQLPELPESQDSVVIQCVQPQRTEERMDSEGYKTVKGRRRDRNVSPPSKRKVVREVSPVVTSSRFKDLLGVEEMGISDSGSEMAFSPGGPNKETWE